MSIQCSVKKLAFHQFESGGILIANLPCISWEVTSTTVQGWGREGFWL